MSVELPGAFARLGVIRGHPRQFPRPSAFLQFLVFLSSWFLASGFWLLVSGFWLLVSGFWLLVFLVLILPTDTEPISP
jgi:hypothetical protein